MAGEVVVRCVKTSRDSPISGVLQEAYEVTKEMGATTAWFTEEECASVETKESRYIYLFESFTGSAFQHILQTGNRIYGPVCVLHCVKKGKALPKEKHPVYNMAMHGLRVNCTSIAKEKREAIHGLVEWMGGQACRDLHQDVTHLVAGEVGSKKYFIAAKLRMKIMTPDWVDAVWDSSQAAFLRADDPSFDRLRCPIFKGYVVTVSGMDNTERAQIKDILHKEGGLYSGEMKKNECTHLVINVPRGQKYEVAMEWGINVVTSQWLFESLKAGYALEESTFAVTSASRGGHSASSHSTSTPTRSRKSVSSMSDAPDISVISVTNVNETNMTLMNSTMASVRNQTINGGPRTSVDKDQTVGPDNVGDLLADLDLTRAGGEMFLDGCKIFLSGFKGSLLEKLRKVINLGGGTRFNQINESVSHVVMGERVESHIQQLQAASYRPHVVSIQWLVACIQTGECVGEEAFLCLDLPALQPTTPKAARSRKSIPKTGSTSARAAPSMSDDTLARALAADGSTLQEAPPGAGPGVGPASGEMEDLLSQYLPGDNSKDTMGESTLMRAAEMGEAANQSKAPSTPANQSKAPSTPANQSKASSTPANQSKASSTPANQRRTEQDMDTSVDPDATVDPHQDASELLLHGLSFVFFGFEPTDEQQMVLFTKEAGGKVLQSNTRRVPDYAIVPLFGYPVGITVGDVATNAWLQICLEQGELCPLTSDPLFTPIDLVPGSTPLSGCVMSISGYKSTERDCILHLASSLGAVVQDYFLKRSNSAKQLKASTHLVVDAAEGSKFDAAVKWKLPAVNKFWVIDCARENKRLDEQAYLVRKQAVDHADQVNTAVDTGQSVQMKQESMKSSTDRSKNVDGEIAASTSRRTRSKPVAMETAPPKEERRDRNELEVEMKDEPRTSPEYRESQKENQRRKPVDEACAAKDVAKKVASNKETKSMLNTPKAVNQRVRALVEENRSTPKSPKNSGTIAGMGPTPSKFLDPNVSFHAKFDLTDFMQSMAPDTPQTPGGSKKPAVASPSLEEVFSHHLALGVQNTALGLNDNGATPYSQRTRSALESQEVEVGPLQGVIIAVSKKLGTQQRECNNIAAALGADYRWTYDRSCTHFIFTGRQNDTNKEFRIAKDQGKIIVSPHWLFMCQEQNCRVDEHLFPHTFNPNLSLSVTPAATRRSTRTSRLQRKPKKSSEESSTSDNDGTTSRISARKIAESSRKMFDSLDTTASDEEMADVVAHAEEQAKESNTQALVKDLKTLMAATKNYSGKTRRSSKRHDGTGKMDDLEPSNKSRLSSSNTRLDSTETPGRKDRRGSRSVRSTPQPESKEEASQLVEVSWDDPIARQHQQMLAHDLAKNSESFSPEHERQRCLGNPPPSPHEDHYQEAEHSTHFKSPLHPFPNEDERVPTPEAPSLAFRLPKRNYSVSPPKPVELAEEDETMEVGEEQQSEQPRLFLLSGMDQNERHDYGALVEELGGRISDSPTFDPSCTHLVVGKPSRNEKFLASVATGKWVLHKSYFEACRQAKHFVQEQQHEWGSEFTASIVQSAAPQAAKLAEAAYRWRCKLTTARGEVGNCGAFDGWRVYLLTDPKRQHGFQRLLEAGGAKVMATRPPFSNLDDITHAFIDMSKVKFSVELSRFVQADIQCVKPEYIAAFLMETDARPEQYYIQEVLPLLNRKRKASPTDPPGTPSKRSKT